MGKTPNLESRSGFESHEILLCMWKIKILIYDDKMIEVNPTTHHPTQIWIHAKESQDLDEWYTIIYKKAEL